MVYCIYQMWALREGSKSRVQNTMKHGQEAEKKECRPIMSNWWQGNREEWLSKRGKAREELGEAIEERQKRNRKQGKRERSEQQRKEG
jgi:hypothetical protein